MRYEFTPDLMTNNSKIDSDHKELFNAVNELHDKLSTGNGAENVDAAMKLLFNYCTEHFEREEKLQEGCSYPGLVTHRNWHTKIKNNLGAFSRKVSNNSSPEHTIRELEQLISLLITHIQTEDKKLADYLNN